MPQTTFKMNEWLAYLSLYLIYDLKGYSQKLFRENFPLIRGGLLHYYFRPPFIMSPHTHLHMHRNHTFSLLHIISRPWGILAR
jgi:hypothetical protein